MNVSIGEHRGIYEQQGAQQVPHTRSGGYGKSEATEGEKGWAGNLLCLRVGDVGCPYPESHQATIHPGCDGDK